MLPTDPAAQRRVLKFGAFAILILAGLLVAGYIAEPTFLDGFKALLGGVL